jgi:hypothetical protein
MEVAEFSTASLDAALFEVPAGYSELKSFSDVGSALAASSQAGTAAQAAPAAKTPGTVRVGIPELGNRTAMTMSAASPRDQLIAELSKSKFDAVPLAGRSAAEFQEAARKLECDYVLEAEVIELKKGSGGLGKFGGLLNKASSLTGAGGAATKEKVEAKVEYKLMPLDGSKPLLSASAQGSNGGGFSVMNAFNPNLMQTLGNMNGIAGAGGGLNLPGMPRGGLDAGVGPFMSIMQATQSAMNPAAPSEEGKALADALNETARNIAQALNKRK